MNLFRLCVANLVALFWVVIPTAMGANIIPQPSYIQEKQGTFDLAHNNNILYVGKQPEVNQIIDKRRRMIKTQFRDMLESLSTSLNSGKNVTDAFLAVQQDLSMQYDEDAFIQNELRVIISGIRNNQDIEVLLYDFGRRTGVKDIIMFASIFRISYRKGGNIKEIIKNTNDIMRDKFDIQEDIETSMTSGKSELRMMMVMPVLMIGMFKGMSPDFGANFTTPAGIMSTTISLVIYGVAYFIGSKIMDIKV